MFRIASIIAVLVWVFGVFVQLLASSERGIGAVLMAVDALTMVKLTRKTVILDKGENFILIEKSL